MSGARLRSLVDNGSLLQGAEVKEVDCVPDEADQIRARLIEWSDGSELNLILTTGGTGFSPRDVTPEATRAVIEKEAPGLSLAMIKGSLEITPLAMLSRPVCGIRKRSLIVNLPGSPKAVEECFRMIAPSLPHAVQLLNGSKAADQTHKQMQAGHIHHPHSTCHHHRPQDPDAVAFRPRVSTFPMISVEQAQDLVLSNCIIGELAVEEVDYINAVGRILAADVTARDPLPPFPASMKDGYAVVAADGSGLRKVIGVTLAGSQPEEVAVRPGFCARISTGAPLPPGADAVVMVEETKLISASEDGRTELEIEVMSKAVVAGQEIRPIGSDIQQGDVVLRRGVLLTPSDVGVLATVGQVKVQVRALPIIAVLSTGNELQESRSHLDPGRIRDSNRPALLSLLKQHGFPVVDAGIAEDELEALHARIRSALERADVLVTTGGVSMGEKDLLRHVLINQFSAQVHFGRVDMKPGKPTTFATCQFNGRAKMIFGLPGNPVSAVVTAHLYVIPACRKLSGHQRTLPMKIRAELQQELPLDWRPEYHRVSLQWHPDQFLPSAASTTANQLSSNVLSLSRASGLAVLPAKTAEKGTIPKGSVVDVIIIDQL